MKRHGNLFSKIVEEQNLAMAHQNAKRGKCWYQEVRMVDKNADELLIKLRESLVLGKHTTSEYKVFDRTCGEKIRRIYKLPYYPDRIVHHAILQVVLPILVKNLIADTYACVPGRGIHKCARKIQSILRLDADARYCLKMDLRKFYPSIDHEIMKSRLRRIIKCERTLALLDEIIDSADTGMPIGNYLSQHLANLYLSGFDHWMKEAMRVKHYFRYSDDIVIMGKDKGELHRLREASANYLAKELKLDVKDNWQVFPIADRGIDFLGYRFYPGYTLLRKSIALKFKRKMRKLQKGNIQPRSALSSVVSYYGWMCHANTLNLRRKHINSSIIAIISRSSEEMKCKNPLRKMVI